MTNNDKQMTKNDKEMTKQMTKKHDKKMTQNDQKKNDNVNPKWQTQMQNTCKKMTKYFFWKFQGLQAQDFPKFISWTSGDFSKDAWILSIEAPHTIKISIVSSFWQGSGCATRPFFSR